MSTMTTERAISRRPARALLLLAVAGVALAACGDKGGKGGEAPTGQVVARLDGEEITMLEVNAELAGSPIPPNVARRDAEKAALNNIVTRRMLSRAAEERELHKTPDFQMQARRASEQLRVQALARDIAAKIATPTRDEAIKFMNENPAMFSERKFFILDQIQFLRPENIGELGFENTKTMAEVEAILTRNNMQFRRQPASLDALGANPDFVREVTKVLDRNPEELFMFSSRPQGAPAPVVLVNQVKDVRVQPFTGDKAREFAVNYLRNQRIQNALKAEMEKQQTAAKDKIVYQAGWEPPATKEGEDKKIGTAALPSPAGPAPVTLPGADAPAAVAGPALPAG